MRAGGSGGWRSISLMEGDHAGEEGGLDRGVDMYAWTKTEKGIDTDMLMTVERSRSASFGHAKTTRCALRRTLAKNHFSSLERPNRTSSLTCGASALRDFPRQVLDCQRYVNRWCPQCNFLRSSRRWPAETRRIWQAPHQTNLTKSSPRPGRGSCVAMQASSCVCSCCDAPLRAWATRSSSVRWQIFLSTTIRMYSLRCRWA